MTNPAPKVGLNVVPPIRSLLLPLDGSRLAEATIPIARELRTRLSASVTLLHVLEHDAPVNIHGEPHLTLEDEADAYLTTIANQFAGDQPHLSVHVHPNPEHDVARSIVTHADEFGAELILIANHGRGGLRELLFGSIAQQVIRQGNTPVLLVPVSSANDADRTFVCRAIGVLVNGTPQAEAVLPAATALAIGLHAEVRLILAVPTVDTLPGDRAAAAMLVPGTTRAILDLEESHLKIYLQTLAEALGQAGVSVRSSIVRGDPASAARAEADRLEVDMLAMATHGRSGIAGLWTGSVGSRVLGKFKRPLLLMKAP